MSYIYTRPGSKYWQFSCQVNSVIYRGSTGIIARDKRYGKKLVNKKSAQDLANLARRYLEQGNIDGLKELGFDKLAKAILKQLDAAKPIEERNTAFEPVFTEYLDQFKIDAQPSAGYIKLITEWWLPRWAKEWKLVQDCTEAKLRDYKRRRLLVVKPNTLHKELCVLRGFLKWCVSAGYLTSVPDLVMPSGKSSFKSQPPSRGQVEQILAALPDKNTVYGNSKLTSPVREFFTFLYFQGLRAGTVQQADWSDIQQKAGRWYFRIRAEIDKAKFDRVVPLHKRAVEALKAVGVKQTGLIFGRHDYRVVLRSVTDKLNLPTVRIHDFRHARIDELVQKTHDLAAVQYLAGHKDIRTTQIYLHADVQRAAKLFDDEM